MKRDISVLLLHGMSFTSKTWLELNTINILSALGYRVVAIDLPGFGNSSKEAHNLNRSSFLYNLIERLNLNRAVIVSPSFSGYYSLPFLLTYWNVLSGYVTVAPVGSEVLYKHH